MYAYDCEKDENGQKVDEQMNGNAFIQRLRERQEQIRRQREKEKLQKDVDFGMRGQEEEKR